MSRTIVTAMLDIGGGEFGRPIERYLSGMEQLLKRIQSPFVIYTQKRFEDFIWKRRSPGNTEVILIEAEDLKNLPCFDMIQIIRNSEEWLWQADRLRESPQLRSNYYNPLVMHKAYWLRDVARRNKFESEEFFWADCGICQNGKYRSFGALVEDGRIHTDKFLIFSHGYTGNNEIRGFERPAYAKYCGADPVKWVVRGKLFGGRREYIEKVVKVYDAILRDTLSKGYMGTEESILTIVAHQRPELFERKTLPLKESGEAGARALMWGKKIFSFHKYASYLRKVSNLILLSLYKNLYAKRIMRSGHFVCAKENGFEIHMVVCKKHVISSLWALKSFYHYSQLRPELVIHDDGSMDDLDEQFYLKHFAGARVIRKKRADEDMEAYLKDFQYSLKFRKIHFFYAALKLFDIFYYAQAKKILIFDSDVLFFKYPAQMVDLIKKDLPFFMSDHDTIYNYPVEALNRLLDVQMLPCVNVGLMFTDAKEHKSSLPEFEKYFKQCCDLGFEGILNLHEQTLNAFVLSKLKAQMLDADYQMLLPAADNTVSRHYVSGSIESRNSFYAEGLRRLRFQGFLEKIQYEYDR